MSRSCLLHLAGLAAASLTLLVAAGCSGGDPVTGRGTTTPADPARAESPETGDAPGRFDGLSVTLRLRSTTVQQGRTLRSRAVIENDSGRTVVDPGCVIAEGRYALVPADDPDAELWVRPMTDCSGPHHMRPGYRDEYRGPDFFARTKYGEPLPPGDYLAVLDIRGLTKRLEYPVTITP